MSSGSPALGFTPPPSLTQSPRAELYPQGAEGLLPHLLPFPTDSSLPSVQTPDPVHGSQSRHVVRDHGRQSKPRGR